MMARGPPKAASGMPPPITLPSTVMSGLKPGMRLAYTLCALPQRHAKAGHHLVEHQQRAVLRAQLAAALHEGHAGAHEVHVAGDRLDHQAGELVAVQREGFFELRHVVVFEHQRVLHHLGRHAGAGRVAEGGQARAGLDQQRVGMAVVAAFELDDLAAAGGAARQADARSSPPRCPS